MLDTLQQHQDKLDLHDFVIMPDHLHLLLSPADALERSVQLLKGSFSFHARRAFAWTGDIWQPGFPTIAFATSRTGKHISGTYA